MRNEAYLFVRRTGSPKAKVFWGASDEGCSATPGVPGKAQTCWGGTQYMDFLRNRDRINKSLHLLEYSMIMLENLVEFFL